MKLLSMLSRALALTMLVLGMLGGTAHAAVQAVIDADEMRSAPVPHRYLHGVILDDAKFQILLPTQWNGKIIIHTRGFSGTEFSTGSFQPAALARGYAFAASDEGWNRVTIRNEPEDSYFESRQRLLELTLYTKQKVQEVYGRASTRTLIMGGSNGGHHTKWMVEDFPELFDGGVAGYGFNSQVSQWGSVATHLRNYNIIAPRIDDIIARRAAQPNWDASRTPLSPPLTGPQQRALRNMYRMPAEIDCTPSLRCDHRYDVGRWPGSEAQWKSQYASLVGYLRDSMPRFDPTFNPNGGALTDDELPFWDTDESPRWVQRELRRLDLTGQLQRPVLIMHGSADPIVSPGETAGYKRMVEKAIGRRNADKYLAVYYIPGMGHGGTEFNNLVGAQIDALEAWIDWLQSRGARGALPPDRLGAYPRDRSWDGTHWPDNDDDRGPNRGRSLD